MASPGLTVNGGTAYSPKSVGSIYNAWAASLPPRVTLNSGKLITID